MKKNTLNWQKILFSSLFLIIIFGLLPLLSNSLEKVLVIYFLLFIYAFSLIYLKNIFFSFLIFLIIALPLNITKRSFFLSPNYFVNGIEVNYLVLTISIVDLGVLLFLMTVVISRKREVLKEVFLKYRYPLIIFLLFLLVQNIILNNPISLFGSLRMLFYMFVALILFEEVGRLKKKSLQKGLPAVSVILFLTVLFQGVLGFLQFKGGSSLGVKMLGESQVVSGMMGSSFVTLQDQVFLRAYGTFPHPNVFAGYLLLMFFSSLFVYRRQRGIYKSLSLLTMLLSFVFVLFTFSRFVILCFLVVSLVIFISYLRGKRNNSFNFMPLLVERFLKSLSGGDESLADRLSLAKTSIYVFRNNWLSGVGLGRFTAAMGDMVPRSSRGIQLIQPVHNVFLLLLSELGLFGFLSFIYLFFSIVKENIKKLTITGFLMVISILGIMMMDHYLFSLPQGYSMLWLFIGLLALESK